MLRDAVCSWLGCDSGKHSNPTIAVRNFSTVLSADYLHTTIQACQEQARAEFADAWFGLGSACTVRLVSRVDGSWPLVVADNGNQAKRALGFHSETKDSDLPFLVIYAEIAQTYGVPVSAVVSHEVLESLANASTRGFSLGRGVWWAQETVDPVQDDLYSKHGAILSDFVYPSWSDVNARGPYDHMRLVTRPFGVRPGGYAITVQNGQIKDVFGTDPPAVVTNRRLKIVRAARGDYD